MNQAVRFRRAGYTILELLIALGLLGTLLAVAWSLLGTYRSAEERGWRQGERLQKVRLARLWLQTDAMQMCEADEYDMADAGLESGGSLSAVSALGEFRGDARGFSIDVLGSIDPLPWLDELMRGVEPLTQTTDLLNSEVGATSALGRDQRTIVSIEYRLVSAGASLGAEPVSNLRRRLTPRDGWQSTKDASESKERLLTSEDLYRVDDEPVVEDASASNQREEGVLQGLEAARFRYSDGTSWKASWDSRIESRLPSAIEFVFDFPTTAEGASGGVDGQGGNGRGERLSGEESIFGSEAGFEETTDDGVAGMFGLAGSELNGSDLTGEGQSRPYDVRVVVVPIGRRERESQSSRSISDQSPSEMESLDIFGGSEANGGPP